MSEVQKVAIVDAPVEERKLTAEEVKANQAYAEANGNSLSLAEQEKLNNARAAEAERIRRGQVADAKVEEAVHDKIIADLEAEANAAKAKVEAAKLAKEKSLKEIAEKEKEEAKKK